MLFASLALLSAMVVATADPDLRRAEEAFHRAEYRAVLPATQRARAHLLPPEELARAYVLEGMTYAAFDNREPAIEAFQWALGADPGAPVDPSTSPKLRALFDEARRRGPRSLAPRPVARVEPSTGGFAAHSLPAPVPRKLWARPWVWGAVGGVLLAGGAVLFFSKTHSTQAGNLGRGELR